MKRMLTVLLFVGVIYAQNNPGYVNKDSIIPILPAYIEYQHILIQRQAGLTDSLQWLMDDFNRWPGCTIFSDKDSVRYKRYLDQWNADLNSRQDAISNYQNYASQIMEKLEDAYNQKMQIQLYQLGKEFCTEHNISFLIDKNQILYCGNCTDYTSEFILFILGKYN